MKHWRVTVLIAVAAVLVAGLAWFAFVEDELVNAPEESTQQTNETSAPTSVNEPPPQEQTYSSSELALSFTYPMDWQTLTCEGSLETIYLASDDRGLGINDSGESILCGGGSDFAPQAVIFQRDEIDQPAGGVMDVEISGVDAKRYVLVASADDELRPEGFTTTTYVIPRSNGQTLVAVYNQYPEGTEGYDTSNQSVEIFEDIIENNLELEL